MIEGVKKMELDELENNKKLIEELDNIKKISLEADKCEILYSFEVSNPGMEITIKLDYGLSILHEDD